MTDELPAGLVVVFAALAAIGVLTGAMFLFEAAVVVAVMTLIAMTIVGGLAAAIKGIAG